MGRRYCPIKSGNWKSDVNVFVGADLQKLPENIEGLVHLELRTRDDPGAKKGKGKR